MTIDAGNNVPHININGPSAAANWDVNDYQQNVCVDGVLRYPPTDKKLIIVGAGVGGLMTALECWRKGFEVTVLEKVPELRTSGDTVGLSPAGLAGIKNYPSMIPKYDEIMIDGTFCLHHLGGERAVPPFEFEYNRPGVPPHGAFPLRVPAFTIRSRLVAIMREQADKLGIEIITNTPIVDYEEDETSGTAVAADGRRFTADIIIAADGLGTKSHKLVLGHLVRAIDSGVSAWRGMYPVEHLNDKDAPHLKKLLAGIKRPKIRLYTDHGLHAILVLDPRFVCVANVQKEFEHGQSVASESWSNTVTGEDVLKQLYNPEKWDPALIEGFKFAPDNTIVAWKLCMRDPQPKWTSKRGYVVQIGDAAHSFLTTSGNGAVQALEDAYSIAECLRLGAMKGDLATATKVHEKLRYQRMTLIQRTGFNNRRQMHPAHGRDPQRQHRHDAVRQVDVDAQLGEVRDREL